MSSHTDWEKLVRRMELLMRLKSFPVAFKMLENKEELDRIPFMRRPQARMTLCQLITLARCFDWTVGAEVHDFIFPTCPSIIGLCDLSQVHKDGTFRSIVWVKNREEGRKYEGSIPRLPLGRYEAVAMAPLVYKPFEPDIVLLYANPAQMMLLINSLQFENYEVMHFYCVGESSCSDAIARCYLSGKPSLTIPCYGERRYGHAQDDDLVMAIPAPMMPRALRGLEALYRRGVRYPISFAGVESDLTTCFPPAYGQVEDLMKNLRGDGRRLLLGVTGGIATGKTTVVKMLEALGAPVIDFDVIARHVVEPGKPAWEKIVEYFGKQILHEDATLDRKRLSKTVFGDQEKRKRLEGFTHPFILQECIAQVTEIAARQPDAIIQIDVPLLIELNLQYMFDKTLLVYAPREKQIERLIKRDGISRQEALERIQAQIPIDEKLGHVDFVIHNDTSLEKTKEQVNTLWRTLKEIQDNKKRGDQDG